jgi:dTDP-4-amino-4,6-dideoxygalactose transaminase
MRIPVSKPFMPEKERYHKLVDAIWERQWITNNGEFLVQFEKKISEFLGKLPASVVTSGTSALQLALGHIEKGSEVITTPFSYVATTSSLVWADLTPVYVDIEQDFLGLDPTLVERSISNKTRAILATHVYGNPGYIEELEQIAVKHEIPLIFDGAHAFGSKFQGRSLLSYGNISTLSFHATKLFHTVNGGAVVCKTKAAKERIDRYRNFGHIGVNEFDGPGINAKMCEFHSAMGLLNLESFDTILAKRREQWFFYAQEIKNRKVKKLKIRDEDGYNAAYFPLIFDDTSTMLRTIDVAQKLGIEIRRYFYPSLNQLEYVPKRNCHISEDIAERICCLPLYHTLTISEQLEVIKLINEA